MINKRNNETMLYIETMLSYYLKCRKITESKNLEVLKTKDRKIMFLSKCEVCNSKKLKFIK